MNQCKFITLECLRNAYITNVAGKQELFSGLLITGDKLDKTYIKSPFIFTLYNNNVHLRDYDKNTFQFGMSMISLSKDRLKEFLENCNCCVEDGAYSKNTYLTSLSDIPSIVGMNEGDVIIIEENGIAYQTIYTAGAWLAPIIIFDPNQVVDLSAIPAYRSHSLAFAALGPSRRFRYTQDNIDGVGSPNGSVHAITQA